MILPWKIVLADNPLGATWKLLGSGAVRNVASTLQSTATAPPALLRLLGPTRSTLPTALPLLLEPMMKPEEILTIGARYDWRRPTRFESGRSRQGKGSGGLATLGG